MVEEASGRSLSAWAVGSCVVYAALTLVVGGGIPFVRFPGFTFPRADGDATAVPFFLADGLPADIQDYTGFVGVDPEAVEWRRRHRVLDGAPPRRASLDLDARRVGTGIGSAGPTPLRAREAEDYLGASSTRPSPGTARADSAERAIARFGELVAGGGVADRRRARQRRLPPPRARRARASARCAGRSTALERPRAA